MGTAIQCPHSPQRVKHFCQLSSEINSPSVRENSPSHYSIEVLRKSIEATLQTLQPFFYHHICEGHCVANNLKHLLLPHAALLPRIMESAKNQDPKQHDMQGYLRRTGKTGKSIGLRRKRFYKLHGAILSKHSTEDSEATWDVNIQGSEVVKLGRTNFVLSLSKALKNVPAHDFDQNTMILYAKSEQECSSWVSSLKYAANRKLENHYEIGPVIGVGGFAKVRVARSVLSGELRAIKTMKKDDKHASLFGTEIAIIKRVSHPNIVKTFDVYETSNDIHIVMEYMEGGMLYESVEHGVRFKEEDIAQFMRELLDGIHYLHQMGIVHRDLKPENVLCTSKEMPLHVKIADFGLSSIADEAQLRAKRMLMSTMTGTPEFIAPEIANREEYTEKVDVWALGMLCYNVICGKLPMDENLDMIPQLRNGISLTFQEPEWEQFGEECKSFIRALLCNKPEKRLTALAGLVHPWLFKQEVEGSNRIAQKSRVSRYLRKQMNAGKPHLSENGAADSTGNQQGHRKLWVVATITIMAVNRFDMLIHPDRISSYDQNTASTSATDSSNKLCSKQTDTINGRISYVPVIDTSDFEDECNSFGKDSDCFTPGNENDSSTNPGSSTGKPSRLSPNAARKAISQEADTRKQQELADVSRSRLPSKKPSLRKKLADALSSEKSGRLAPVRKLSKRLARWGGNTHSSSSQEINIDLALQELNIVDVDDSDLLRLEESEKQKAALIDKSDGKLAANLGRNTADLLSPVTPHKGS